MAFLIISCIVFITMAFFAPKRLPKHEVYAIALFSIAIGYTTDTLFDLKYNLYGYIQDGVQIAGYLPILVLFPTSGVLYMNFFPYKKSLLFQFFYIVFWTIFCLVFEYLSVKAGYFYYNSWKYWYSALTYPVLLIVHFYHLKFFRYYTNNKIQ
jgi:hypothetical protein